MIRIGDILFKRKQSSEYKNTGITQSKTVSTPSTVLDMNFYLFSACWHQCHVFRVPHSKREFGSYIPVNNHLQIKISVKGPYKVLLRSSWFGGTNCGIKYGKTPIYRASLGKGKRHGKSGAEKIGQNVAYVRFKIISYVYISLRFLWI
jgi:hypothetical protein